jgi:pilus assembly protein CpaF
MSAPTIDDAVHHQVLAQVGPLAEVDRDLVETLVRSADPLLPVAEVDATVARVQSRIGGLGPLDPLLADPEVSEVMVNGPGPVWVERLGRIERTSAVLDTATINHLLQRIVTPLGLRIDPSSPMVDARLADGSRVNAVVPPLAVDGPCLTIRRFRARAVPLEAVAAAPVVALLRWAVARRRNIVVSGGTGAGKTTLLNALASAIGRDERVVTVEDAAELRIPHPHVVRLEARPSSVEGLGAVPIRQLVRNALRMRPDRLIIGEVRGAEALDMLQAMNTGHEGSLSTCHANGPDDALRRLETMVLMGEVSLPLLAVREQLTAAVDLIVQIARQGDGGRRIAVVSEVLDDVGRYGTRPIADGTRVFALPRRRSRLREGDGPGPRRSAA